MSCGAWQTWGLAVCLGQVTSLSLSLLTCKMGTSTNPTPLRWLQGQRAWHSARTEQTFSTFALRK